MTSPMQRLTRRKAALECRICAWLTTLAEKDRAAWQTAILDTRFGSKMVGEEVALEMEATDYTGLRPGEQAVNNHRQRGHR